MIPRDIDDPRRPPREPKDVVDYQLQVEELFDALEIENEITDEEAQAWVTEQQQLGARGEFYFASTQVCFTATRPIS